MTKETPKSPVARRSFLTRFGAGATAFGAAFAVGVPSAKAQTGSIGSDWEPTRHAEDDWFDELPGGHRFILDNTTSAGFSGSMLYANNFMNVNNNAYGLENSDMAVVILARHFSTPFAFNDAMWAKYGETLTSMSGYEARDGVTPTANPYGGTGNGPRGMSLESLFEKGVQIALCNIATRNFTGGMARAAGSDADDVYEEVTNNLVANARLVPAGIVAISRAQERGYTFSFTP
jgi:intracellular sulfur oxidation DsrE/DsrF family protein